MNAILAFGLRILLVILSYLFIGWITFLIYSDLKDRGKVGLTKKVPSIRFQFKDEIESPIKEFTKTELVLGRDPACDLPLKDDRVSMRHCKISFYQNHWWVEDLGSTNGTYLNNTIISKNTVLMNEDILRLGHQEILIEIG